MGKTYERIEPRLQAFIEEQPVFFVATAPLAPGGHVNVSPKGRSGSLVVLDPRTVAYLDFGGSHAETVAHLRENGRITVMWCAFTGPPNIVRVHGHGEPVFRDDPRWADLISDTCGFAVPFMDYQGERDLHADYFGRKTDEQFAEYCAAKPHNAVSLDGLPALPARI